MVSIQLLLIALSVITIFFSENRIILESTVILLLTLINLALFLVFAIIYLKKYQFDSRNPYSYIGLDAIVYLILNIVGFGLMSFDFNILFLLIVHIISFVYCSCMYNIKNYIWNDYLYE